MLASMVMVAVLSVATTGANAEGLTIVVTTPDIGDLSKRIVGSRGEVIVLASPTQDPHFLDPQPGLMVELNRADLLVYNGLELEVGWLPTLLTGSANAKIQSGQRGHLNCSVAIEGALEVPEVNSRELGDVHPLGNPHYMLSPKNARRVARVIAGRLIELDPDGATEYGAQLKSLLIELDEKTKAWEERLAPFKGKRVLTYHRDWSYLAQWAGLVLVGELESVPGIPPDPSRLAELVLQYKNGGVELILLARWDDKKLCAELSEQISVPSFVGTTQPASDKGYIDMIEGLVSGLEDALK
jgi:zinc/manganese transport system substrate-binding protein